MRSLEENSRDGGAERGTLPEPLVIDDRNMEMAYWRDENGLESVPPANSGRTPCKHSKSTTSLQPHYVEIHAVQSHQQSPSVENAKNKKVHK